MLGNMIRGAAGAVSPQLFLETPLEKELQAADPESSLFQRYAVDMTVSTDQGTVKVHTVQAPQPNAKKIDPLPPVYFIHGLGGQISSFRNLAEDLNRITSIIAIDLPGYGKSPDPKNWDSVGPDATVEIVDRIIQEVSGESPFVLVGHSLGCTTALRIATRRKSQCLGVVAVAPPFRPDLWAYERAILRWMPTVVFDLGFRSFDRRGELHSPSVNRAVAASATEDVRRQQLQINVQSRSLSVLQTIGRVRFYDPVKEGRPDCPILVLGASEDRVCPIPQQRALVAALEPRAHFAEVPVAGHALLFEQPEIISAVVGHFLQGHVDERLSMSWQLQYLASREDKWSLKNEEKWMHTKPVGSRVGSSVLCGMKVLRQNDPEHGPRALEVNHPEIMAVVDISRDVPPYDPSTFERIKYHKFPTVSKVPPRKSEVAKFVELINSIAPGLSDGGLVGVHCHYGFNRTGFFICCYLIEALGYKVSDAISAYAESRPPGIRHAHFIDELYLRYNLQ